jgi:hypothetical protein
MNRVFTADAMRKKVIGALSIVLVLSIGYYIFLYTPTIEPVADPQTENISSAPRVSVAVPLGWIDRSNTLGPPAWNTVDKDGNPADSARRMHFISPDYADCEVWGMDCMVAKGYWLEVIVSEDLAGESIDTLLTALQEGSKTFGGVFREITIDGERAVLSDVKAHGSYVWAQTFRNGRSYYFRLNAPDERAPGVQQLFLDILATAQLP